MKRYEGTGIKVDTFKRGGYYILRISQYKTYLVATKNSRKSHTESGWMPEYEKKFEEAGRANNYFKAIKKSYPDMVMVADEPNKYISYDGTVKQY